MALQASAGNRAVRDLLAPTVQRDLAAYTREHVEVESPMAAEGPPTMETTSADAPGIEVALRPLISAGKVGTKIVRDMRQFWSTGATRADLVAALSAAYPAAVTRMVDGLLDEHRITLYSADQTTIIPGLIWDTRIASSAQNTETQTRRGLTNAELTAATSVYGSSLAYDTIVLEDAPVMAIGGYARTTPWTVNFPTGTLAGGGPDMPWLIHELGHSWQYARGVGLSTTLYHAIRGVYAYGGEAELLRRTAAGQTLSSFNTEQQADIASDAYRVLNGAPGNRAAYAPYLAEFRAGAYR